MRDDPRRNLKQMQQALLYEEVFQDFDQMQEEPIEEDEDLLERVDQLIEDLESEEEYEDEDYEEEEEPPIRNFANNYGIRPKNQPTGKNQTPQKLDKNAAVLVKTRRQLRKEARIQKKRERKSGVNRNLKGLILLAILEVLGILAVLGWWLT